MAMMAGLTGVRSAVCSQFTMDPRTGWFNQLKVRLPIPQLLRSFGVRNISPDTEPTLRSMTLDVALTPIPVPRGERCGSALCRWVNLIYGMTHRHAQLNDETHRALVDSFGIGNLRAIEHLGLIMRKGAVDHCGHDVYRLNPHGLAIPIHFLVGKENSLFFPDSTEETLRWLGRHNPPSLYTCTEFAEYAHLDCFVGKRAAEDVFPDILERLEAT
jgi:cholesterol oxidase